MGLHQRYARWLGHLNGDTVATFSHQDEVRKQLTHLFDGMMKALYRQEGANLDINIIASDEAQQFITTHAGALDASFSEVKMSDIMRQRLQRSNYIFSGMKTFHELNEAFPSLLDENGNRKSFERFLNDVRKIDSTYNSNYLRAEYNYVQASAQMAARWEEFAADGDRYNLQYRTMGDNKVRPAHADLHGVTLPMSDPFWEEFYPPNGWNCRCTVVQVRKSKYPTTDHDEAMALGELATGKDTKGIFRFNSGKQQKTFPDYNPYTIRRCKDCDIAKGKMKLAFIPDNELCAACQLIRGNATAEHCKEYKRFKDDPDYTDVSFNEHTGGLKAIHRGHNFDEMVGKYGIPRGEYEKITVDAMYKKGYKIVLEDESDQTDGVKKPDGYLNDSLMDIKGIEGNPLYALSRANRQRVETAILYYHKPDIFDIEDITNKYTHLESWLERTHGKAIPVSINRVICVVNKGNGIFDIVEIKKP